MRTCKWAYSLETKITISFGGPVSLLVAPNEALMDAYVEVLLWKGTVNLKPSGSHSPKLIQG